MWITPKHIGVKDLPTDMQGIFAEQTYDVILFNDIGLHAWTPGRIPEGQYEPLMRAHLANLRKFAPKAKLIFASTTPMTTKTKPIALDPEFNPLIVERNGIGAKIMQENQIPIADFYGILVVKLDLAAGDRFPLDEAGLRVACPGGCRPCRGGPRFVAAGWSLRICRRLLRILDSGGNER